MPLKVLIAGAGIGGLAAALSIGKQGHDVYLFEASAFSNEVGAALHLGPHAMRIMHNLGITDESLNGNVCSQWRELNYNHVLLRNKFCLREKQKALGVCEDELMMHRVDVHSRLRKAALDLPNVYLHLASPVESVDPVKGILVLRNGTSHRGDIIVGADGVHSRTIQAIEPSPIYRVGVNMYRFMVQTAKALAVPSVKGLLDSYDYAHMHDTYHSPGKDIRMLVMYPCRNGSMLNLATFQPSALERVGLGDDYTTPGTIEEVLELFQSWPEHYVELFKLAEDIKHWACISREPVHSFVKDRLVVIGDAAHPTLPTHGAGAGMAVEDAAVLGTVLDETAEPENVGARLELYNQLRYSRATTVKVASEMLGPPGKETDLKRQELLEKFLPKAKIPANMETFLWPVDVVAEAKAALETLK